MVKIDRESDALSRAIEEMNTSHLVPVYEEEKELPRSASYYYSDYDWARRFARESYGEFDEGRRQISKRFASALALLLGLWVFWECWYFVWCCWFLLVFSNSSCSLWLLLVLLLLRCISLYSHA